MDDFLDADFRAQLTFLTEQEGGLRIPVGHGYRAVAQFDHLDDTSWIAMEFTQADLA